MFFLFCLAFHFSLVSLTKIQKKFFLNFVIVVSDEQNTGHSTEHGTTFTKTATRKNIVNYSDKKKSYTDSTFSQTRNCMTLKGRESVRIIRRYQTTTYTYNIPEVLTPTPTLPFRSFSAQQPQPNNAACPQQTEIHLLLFEILQSSCSK